MFLDDKENRKQITRWIIGIFAACILLYLGIRHINVVVESISYILGIISPIITGCVMALVINVPLRTIEGKFLNKTKLKKLKRPLAIVLSLVLIIGIFLSVILLVIPEVAKVFPILSQMVMDWVKQFSADDFALIKDTAVGKFIEDNIDFDNIVSSVEKWLKDSGTALMNTTINAIGSTVSSTVSSIVNFFVGFVFAIYVLAQKEKLKRQVCYLINVWIPEKITKGLFYVSSVCYNCFCNFVAGQTTEAFILGILCTIGMLILQLPYAPMIGALIGVTAFFPIVGAYIGGAVGVILILTESPIKAVIFLVFLIVLQQIEGNLIYPRVVGSKINLPAIWVLAAICIGGNLCGALGMLLGVPVFSAAYTLIKETTAMRAKKLEDNEKAHQEQSTAL